MQRTHFHTSTRPCLCIKPWVMLRKLPTFARRHWNVSFAYGNPCDTQYIWHPRDSFLVDPACDAAVASLAQILLELGKAEEALGYYEMAIGLARTQPELEHAISYVEATKAQIRYAYQRHNVGGWLNASDSYAQCLFHCFTNIGSHKNILKLLPSCVVVVVECKKTRCKKKFSTNIEAFLRETYCLISCGGFRFMLPECGFL